MQYAFRHALTSTLTALLFLAFSAWSQAGTSQLPNQDVKQLTLTLHQLKAEQSRARHLQDKLTADNSDYSARDKQRLQVLKRKQAESRMRIDALTMELIRLTEQLQDPEKRLALAKKLQQGPPPPATVETASNQTDSTNQTIPVSARSVDLEAMQYIREGQSLDQARLTIIENLRPEDVLTFYQELPREERYELYDMADEIARTEHTDLVAARRTAIYFYLFAR